MSSMTASGTGGGSRSLILTAMIFAVAMTFIDQTIVSIAAPTIQHDLGLSASGIQWAINAYLLTLAALFAFGGRLADTHGHRKMVVLGVILFAGASALCGATPRGGAAEAWLVAFRALQGAGGAIMFPAAIAIVVATFDLRSRGRALALFFGIAGALTAIGPIAGGYLIEWTWRAIFWINIPVALIALALIAISRPPNESRPAPMDHRGLVLVAAGVGLSVFGFQQSALWGWGNPAIWVSIAVGVVLLVMFSTVEHRTESPLINVRIFGNRTFTVENVILGLAMMAFIPVFFFASVYGQIALAEKATTSSLLILYFFLGFVVCAQIGGRMLDRIGAKRPVVLGSAAAAVGFALWAGKVTDLHAGTQVIYIVMAGAGMGLMLGQANTDAINRASRYSYGEATGITQTVRNYGASLGFAILGTILITRFRSAVTSSLTARGLSGPAASAEAAKIAQLQGGNGSIAAIPQFIRADFAVATRDVLYGMTIVMAVTAVVALRGLRRGVQQEPEQADARVGAALPGEGPAGRLIRLSAEEPCHVGGVGVQGCPGAGVQRGERCEHDLAAGYGPGRHGPAAGQRERPEQSARRDDAPVRADDRVPGGPAEQQRVERAQQPRRRQRGSRVPRARRQPGQPVGSLHRAAPGQAEPGIPKPDARPQGEVAVGRRGMPGEVTPGQLTQRHLAADHRRRSAQPVPGQHERLVPPGHRAPHDQALDAGQRQDVHHRLAFGPHSGGRDPLAQLRPGQRAVGGQRLPHGRHRALRVVRRHALLRQPAGVAGAQLRCGQRMQPPVVLGADQVQGAPVQPADDQRAPREGGVDVRGGQSR
jgi:EmrB/QacA subfamily drug resistance transporter